ncbi:hypothetical protein [Lactobacillus delbrueckii]|uniref:hypothetical protein n=1 Tax=Lactobacillus delbrueckii TaxID=1584 RepID=UPI00069A15DC|nr:hypothetical protein [Lactobacillus delbrueckii]KNZ37367.1 hypothetical protein LDD39_08955 [Lactobacillus delbrueckii subsp. delbrueckii]MCT3493744.1 hypothetical protein [Lactobacillus delbrueckii]MCT3521807.1 hypothetical protein [Lactobacillus delbrueckii]
MLYISKHLNEIIKISDEFEAQLYDWAKQGSSSPQGAIDKIKRMMAEEWPDGYAANRDSVIKISLIRKEAEDVIRRIKKEALARPWDTSSEDTSKS